jgi:hypothetical protein
MKKNKKKELHIGGYDGVKGYKNISLKLDTYKKVFDLSHSLIGTPLSVAKTIEYLADNYTKAVDYDYQRNSFNLNLPQYLPIKRIAKK